MYRKESIYAVGWTIAPEVGFTGNETMCLYEWRTAEVIVTSRFYCVACGRILSVDTEYPMESRGIEEAKVSGSLSYEQSISRMKDLPHIIPNQVFRTGFYRNEMPLGYCNCCQNGEEAVEEQQEAAPTAEEEHSPSPEAAQEEQNCFIPANTRDRFSQIMLH
ncbi:hypothetical protein MHB81_07360 [Paenibacillus sp. FSL H7-0326]